MPATMTLAVAVRSPAFAVIVAWPSCTGVTTPSTTVATSGSLDDHSIASTTWRPTSPRSTSWTISRWRLSGVLSADSGGKQDDLRVGGRRRAARRSRQHEASRQKA